MLLDVGDDAMTPLLRLLPVEDARARRDVAAHGRQTDFDMVVQHTGTLLLLLFDGIFRKQLNAHMKTFFNLQVHYIKIFFNCQRLPGVF